MKTAEEWIKQNVMPIATGIPTGMFTIKIIRQIQSDALREAADIADDFITYPDKNSDIDVACKQIRDAILAKAKEIE